MSSLPSISNNNNMGIEVSSQNLNHVTEVPVSEPKAKRTRTRIVGNGKTCHQCRQKIIGLAASCKNLKAGKPCVIRLCHKCLLNRYGETAEEVELLSNWSCPKCKGICNCSYCRKQKGLAPTGALVHTAKASGFKSVADMLQNANNVAVSPMEEATLEISNGNSVDNACENRSPKRAKIGDEVPEEESKINANDGIIHLHEVSEKEMQVATNHDIVYGEMDGPEKWAANDFFFNPMNLIPKTFVSNPVTLAPRDYLFNPNLFVYDVKAETSGKKLKGTEVGDVDDNAGFKSRTGIAQAPEFMNCTVNSEIEKIQEVPLPRGTMLTEILEVEFPSEDVGNALQFLEFCRVFGKALDVKKGEAEAILREMVRKQNLRRGENTLAVHFQIRLLTVILIDSGIKSLSCRSPSLTTTNGKNSWLKALEDVISGSVVLKEFPLDWLEEGMDGYYNLDLSKKLSLLNFLCDEALGTEKLRSYISDQNLIFFEEVKEAKSKVAAAKEKEKCLKEKLHDEMFQAIASNGSSSEHDALLSKINSEAAEAHAELLEAKEAIPKRKQSSDVTRTDPVFLDDSGQKFWKLKSYTAEYAVLLQDIKVEEVDGTIIDEKWFVYDLEKKHEVDKYISSRAKRPKAHKVSCILSNESTAAIL